MSNYIFSFKPKTIIVKKPDIFYSIHSPNGICPIVETRTTETEKLLFELSVERKDDKPMSDVEKKIIVDEIMRHYGFKTEK